MNESNTDHLLRYVIEAYNGELGDRVERARLVHADVYDNYLHGRATLAQALASKEALRRAFFEVKP